ncbi:hypothetical protein J2X72_001709 [Phyllobacterium sp. 1468]|nr:hypothetical protein [Phyllobacterium sp. 1468]
MSFHRPRPPDKSGLRQPETQPLVCFANHKLSKPLVELSAFRAKCGSTSGPGEFGPIPSGFGFLRWVNIGLAKSLDLEPNSLRQNASIQAWKALASLTWSKYFDPVALVQKASLTFQ